MINKAMGCLLKLLFFPFYLLWFVLFGRKDMVFVADDDPEMIQARMEAKLTFPAFKEHLISPEPGMGEFGIKVSIPTQNGTEHIWTDHLEVRDGVIHGKLANHPNEIPDMQLGSPIEIDEKRISDWGYSVDGYFHGHYTTRVLIPHMSKKMRKMTISHYGWEKDCP